MITIENRKLSIPKEDKHIGFTGDNLVETRCFCFSDKALSDFTFQLDIQKSSGETDILPLDKSISDNGFELIWRIERKNINIQGVLLVQIRGYTPNWIYTKKVDTKKRMI